jgi:transposase-like protein
MPRIPQEQAADKPAAFVTAFDLDALIRGRVRATIEEILLEELETALGAERHERGEHRRGHRNGSRERVLTCQAGTTTIAVPRGRLFREDGASEEHRSRFLPYYQRRTQAVNDTLLAAYVSGASTRKVKKALAPLWRKGPLSRSAVSRLAPRLRARWELFQERDLSERTWLYLYLDALMLRVRISKKVVRVPVRVAVGVDTQGHKELLSLELKGSESTAAWSGFCEALASRGVVAPRLVIVDGSKGLCAAVATTWPGAELQRCTVHKEWNLLAHAPRHAEEAIRTDYRAIVDAKDEAEARSAWRRFVKKWEKKLPAVVHSLEEGGEQLLTFYRYPESQRRCLRSTNLVERMNKEFRRRVKVQESLPDPECAVALLHALWADGCLRMRRLDGHQDIASILARREAGVKPTQHAA